MNYYLLVIVATIVANVAHGLPVETFERFKEVYGKTYATPEEESLRREIFQQSLAYVRSHEDASINQFADLTVDEFQTRYTMDVATYRQLKQSRIQSPWGYGPCNITERPNIPDSLDLRQKGTTSPIKDQMHCGACWAFSAVAAVESAYLARKNISVILSEQDLVDCKSGHGCGGGLITDGLDYIKKTGIVTNDVYPYVGKETPCEKHTEAKRFKISEFCQIRPKGEDKMKQILFQTNTAISVIIGIKNMQKFQFYNGKTIIRENGNEATRMHGVNVVGYGNRDGIDYWIVRNSWNENWGDHGYAYFEQHKDLMGIDEYPYVVSAL